MGQSRRMQNLCSTVSGTETEIWQRLYGTEAVGQLPQWKKDQHEGHCWHPCPYSTQCSPEQTRNLLGLADTDPLPTQADHTDGNGKEYFMRTQYKNSWGYECTFETCPYYTTVNPGTRYFYS
jgi:hypothetical protein